MRKVIERAVTFGCEDQTLFGILHIPTNPSDFGVIVIVGGPQYRAGSHRQFVLLARALAAAGFAVLRFDYRGMGDSTGKKREFDQTASDIGSAIDTLQAQAPKVRRVVLWGLCDGASAALLYLDSTHDPRIQGLSLLNPWVRSETSLARTHVRHYYLRRLIEGDFWTKLITGGISTDAWRDGMRNVRAQWVPSRDGGDSFQSRMARAWVTFQGEILLVLSGNDLTAKEFDDTIKNNDAWKEALGNPRTRRQYIAGADHTFSRSEWRLEVERATVQWLNAMACVSNPVLETT